MPSGKLCSWQPTEKPRSLHFNLSADSANSKMSLTCVGEREREREREREWARVKRKPFPGREEKGGGVFGTKKQMNSRTFLPINALRLLKKMPKKK